jgi:acyl-coenzyme A thioesterase PaaI-like protein
MGTVPLTVEQLQRDLSRSAFINFLGLEEIEADPSKQEVSMRMVMRPEFERYPDSGQWHGGPIAAAIDTVGDYALAMMLGRPLPTVNFRVDYLKPAIKTSLTIVGRCGVAARAWAWAWSM